MSKVLIQDIIHFVPETLTLHSHIESVVTGATLCGLIVVRHEDYMGAVREPRKIGEPSGPLIPAQLVQDLLAVTCIGCISQGR